VQDYARINQEVTKVLYNYIKYGRFGARPHQLAKAWCLDEAVVASRPQELKKQGKIQLRSSNIEWKKHGKTW